MEISKLGCQIITLLTILHQVYFSYAAQDHYTKSIEFTVWSGLQGWGLQGRVCKINAKAIRSQCTSTKDINYFWKMKRSNIHSDEVIDGEGLVLTVINQRNGRLIFRKIFPLQEFWSQWVNLQWHMQRIVSGRIVVLDISVRGSIGLRQARAQLAAMGSFFAEHLTPAAHWIWIFIKGGRTITETAVIDGSPNIYQEVLLALSQQTPFHQIIREKLQKERWKFCEKQGVMGDLCDEHNPAPLPIPIPPRLNPAKQDALANVPFIITGGNRPHYLYYTLKKILSSPGANPSNLMVVLGSISQSSIELLQLLDIKYTTLDTYGTGNRRQFRYYRKVFSLIAENFGDSKSVITMDEDIEVSPDFFSFISQTMKVLLSDPTIYCITGHGRHRNISNDIKRVFRGKTLGSWGFVVTLDFVREAMALWVTMPEDMDQFHDLWLYWNVAKDRECIFPDVSRTRHYGIGINNIPLQTETYFQAIPLVNETDVVLTNPERLVLQAYRQDLTESIKRAIILSGNPCSQSFIPKSSSPTTYVFYINMTTNYEGFPDIDNLYKVRLCFGAWGLSPFHDAPQDLHEGLVTFTFPPNLTLHIVGVPYSSYSFLRPSIAGVWSHEMEGESASEINLLDKYTYTVNRHMTSEKLMEIILAKNKYVHTIRRNMTSEKLMEIISAKN